MNKINYLCHILLVTILFGVIGCNKKTQFCTLSSRSISENLWNVYYPYSEGEIVVFENDEGDSLVFVVETIETNFDSCSCQFICDCPVFCECICAVAMRSDGFRIQFGVSNGRVFGCVFSSPEWHNYFSMIYEGVYDSLEYGLGESIQYAEHENAISHIKDVEHIRCKGLVSFYDIENQCVWRLVE